jgi:L-aminopeptidase/D-esterase-like protein
VNSIGDVIDPASGRIIAGARKADGKGFIGIMNELRSGYQPDSRFPGNTVLAVVATNASLTKTQCATVARMAQDALARCINPSHMPWDGDSVFAIGTGTWTTGTKADPGIIGALAADVLVAAIIRAIMRAESWGSFPAASDYESESD